MKFLLLLFVYQITTCVSNFSSLWFFCEIKIRLLLTPWLCFLARGCAVHIEALIQNFFLNPKPQKLQAVENSNFAQWSSHHLNMMSQNYKRFDKDLLVLLKFSWVQVFIFLITLYQTITIPVSEMILSASSSSFTWRSVESAPSSLHSWLVSGSLVNTNLWPEGDEGSSLMSPD